MKKIYILLATIVSTTAFAQQTISFENSEGFQLGNLHNQNDWEVTDSRNSPLINQVISNEKASEGSFSFKNGHEPNYEDQWLAIFGASKLFDTPQNFHNFTISYDVLITNKIGSDFEFTLFAVNSDEEWTPVAGVGMDNRGFIYLIKDENYGIDYATSEWEPNQWTNFKVEVTQDEIKYYINNNLEHTIANFSQLDIYGFNMLHNNYGYDAYYDNFIITTENLSINPFERTTIAVYPNPAQNHINITAPNGNTIESVTIYNVTGQQVYTTDNTQNINIAALANGAYIVKATTINGVTYTQKIFKN